MTRGVPKRVIVMNVVTPVILLLAMLGVLLSALANVRRKAYRAGCGSNLSGIGKAMLIYAADYDGEFPRSGGADSRWAGAIENWKATDRHAAYGLAADGSGGVASISSSFYLLVKYAEALPETFICPGDRGTGVFNPAKEGAGDRPLYDLWDFGARPTKRCSYSYHHPFSLFRLTKSSNPGMAVAADRNPFIWSPRKEPKDISLLRPDGGRETVEMGNAYQQKNDGQNVLFLDSHVGFEKRPFCGVDDDNIYTFWSGGDIRVGAPPFPGSEPMDKVDSLLVHDAP